MERKRPRHAMAKPKLRRLADLDARTGAARAAFELRNSIIAERYPDEDPTTAQLCLIEHIAVLGAAMADMAARFLAGEGGDMAGYAVLANAQRRLLADIGLERRAREINTDLKSYMRAKAA